MSHKHGTYLGAVRCAETLRGRCVIDPDTGCWHLRTSRGRPMPRGTTLRVWVHGEGSRSARAFAWGAPLPDGHCIMATCQSYDCVRRSHLRCVPRVEAVQRAAVRDGWKRAPKRVCANLLNGRRRAKLTPELAQWALDSPQSQVECGIALDVAPSVVGNIRTGKSWRVAGWGAP